MSLIIAKYLQKMSNILLVIVVTLQRVKKSIIKTIHFLMFLIICRIYKSNTHTLQAIII